jgi:Zn-dependent oligopeptidase
MSDDRDIPTTIVEIPDVDAAMFRLRLAGKSARDIAKELHVKEDKVRETVQRMLMPITPQLKLTALQEALERLDLYQASQHQAAVKGDREAIAMCLKIEEQRADLLGTRAPASLRIDPVQLREQAEPQPTTTDRIRAALDRIAAMRDNSTTPAEESVRLIRGKVANGSPSGGEPELDPEPDPAA